MVKITQIGLFDTCYRINVTSDDVLRFALTALDSRIKKKQSVSEKRIENELKEAQL